MNSEKSRFNTNAAIGSFYFFILFFLEYIYLFSFKIFFFRLAFLYYSHLHLLLIIKTINKRILRKI